MKRLIAMTSSDRHIADGDVPVFHARRWTKHRLRSSNIERLVRDPQRATLRSTPLSVECCDRSHSSGQSREASSVPPSRRSVAGCAGGDMPGLRACGRAMSQTPGCQGSAHRSGKDSGCDEPDPAMAWVRLSEMAQTLRVYPGPGDKERLRGRSWVSRRVVRLPGREGVWICGTLATSNS